MPWNRTVIYEAHVKGMTMLHPDVPEEIRGTYLGLATDPIIDHLLSLGATAIELLPVHHFVTERRLAAMGLVNYWGYGSIGYFAPDVRYATGGLGQQVAEFKSMVKRFHRAGIEVILDVDYNHTAEGNHLGPTLSFRGLDNDAYYRLDPGNLRYYVDYTGTGNTIDIRHSRSMQLVMDSLRYWVADMHVDGFRFDLAQQGRILGQRPPEVVDEVGLPDGADLVEDRPRRRIGRRVAEDRRDRHQSIARTRAGPPVPPACFGAPTKIVAPAAGSPSRLVRFSIP
jgi:glycogen debranching enzyme GlgX